MRYMIWLYKVLDRHIVLHCTRTKSPGCLPCSCSSPRLHAPRRDLGIGVVHEFDLDDVLDELAPADSRQRNGPVVIAAMRVIERAEKRRAGGEGAIVVLAHIVLGLCMVWHPHERAVEHSQEVLCRAHAHESA